VHGVPSKLPRHTTNLTRSRSSETGQKREGFDTAELSNEVGRTPARDSGFAEVSHLGRACAWAYRGEDEHNGGLGAKNGPLARPAVRGGASASNGAAAELLLRERVGKKRESGRVQSGVWGAGCRPERGKPVGQRRVHNAGVRPPRGWRRVEQGGRPRAEEGRGKLGRAAWLGRKGGGRPTSVCPLFSFFEFLFSKKLK